MKSTQQTGEFIRIVANSIFYQSIFELSNEGAFRQWGAVIGSSKAVVISVCPEDATQERNLGDPGKEKMCCSYAMIDEATVAEPDMHASRNPTQICFVCAILVDYWYALNLSLPSWKLLICDPCSADILIYSALRVKASQNPTGAVWYP
jgi:hypothetical protein